jgi:hypothetical protein
MINSCCRLGFNMMGVRFDAFAKCDAHEFIPPQHNIR